MALPDGLTCTVLFETTNSLMLVLVAESQVSGDVWVLALMPGANLLSSALRMEILLRCSSSFFLRIPS